MLLMSIQRNTNGNMFMQESLLIREHAFLNKAGGVQYSLRNKSIQIIPHETFCLL